MPIEVNGQTSYWIGSKLLDTAPIEISANFTIYFSRNMIVPIYIVHRVFGLSLYFPICLNWCRHVSEMTNKNMEYSNYYNENPSLVGTINQVDSVLISFLGFQVYEYFCICI